MPLPLAVLIDGENIPDRLFVPLKEMVDALGIVTSWQLFGDFFTWPHPGWHEVANANGVEIRHQFNGGKNAADIAMTIAAMDLMHAGKVRSICLVSSDSDFSALARRLRADTMHVHGFGEGKAPKAYRDACTTYSILVPPLALGEPPAARVHEVEEVRLRLLRDLLHSVCREKGTDGRVHASVAANYLQDKAPDLYASVSPHFVRKVREFGLVDVDEVDGHSMLSIRRRPLTVVR